MLKRLLGRDDEDKLEEGLAKTRRGFMDRLASVFGPVDITEDTWDDLEAQLIQSDVGVGTSVDVVTALREEARYAGVRRADELPELLHEVMVDEVRGAARAAGSDDDGDRRDSAAGDGQPHIILVVGVNGSGKTTTIAKLARLYRDAGRSVLLVAADTFRAAAIDQLQIWGDRVGVPVVAGQQGGDPGAVVYDALTSTVGRDADVVIVDTAGRLHTQKNLMAELVKIRGVVDRVVPGSPHETLLVLDATTGQNGLSQAKAFTDAVDVSGVVLAKLDSSAKGGVAFSVTRELGLPIVYVGTGEAIDDLAPFDAGAYVDGVLGAAAS
ncbi:MAG: signal recognition particle-docking protein FtsY [Anaerolineae bacterium]